MLTLQKIKKKIAQQLLLKIVVVLSFFLFLFIPSVSALSWVQPKQPVTQFNISSSNISTSQVIQTNGTYWVGQILQDILDLVYAWLTLLSGQVSTLNQTIIDVNTTVYSVNSSLYNLITSINQTLSNASEVRVYYEYVNLTTSAGSGTAYSSNAVGFEITRLTVTPSSLATKYRFSAIENSTSTTIDSDLQKHTGVWDIYKSHALNNDIIKFDINSATPDDTFQIKVTYIDNFRP